MTPTDTPTPKPQMPAPVITSIDPATPAAAPSIQGGAQSITFRGAGFQTGLVLRVKNPQFEESIKAPQIQNVSPTSLFALVTVAIANATYSARVENPDGSVSDWFEFDVR